MFTDGEFSKLGRIYSPRMLRYYDAMGLLRPPYGENGYRYYDAAQPHLAETRHWKDYGFALSEIGELLTLSEQELAVRLHRRRLWPMMKYIPLGKSSVRWRTP